MSKLGRRPNRSMVMASIPSESNFFDCCVTLAFWIIAIRLAFSYYGFLYYSITSSVDSGLAGSSHSPQKLFVCIPVITPVCACDDHANTHMDTPPTFGRFDNLLGLWPDRASSFVSCLGWISRRCTCFSARSWGPHYWFQKLAIKTLIQND